MQPGDVPRFQQARDSWEPPRPRRGSGSAQLPASFTEPRDDVVHGTAFDGVPVPWDPDMTDIVASPSMHASGFMDESIADTSTSSTRGSGAQLAHQAYLRAQYEVKVWELCTDYGLSSPAQLLPFMRTVGADVARCRERLRKYVYMLAHHYRTSIEHIVEMLRVQDGDFDQLVRTMDVMARMRTHGSR